MYVHLSCTDTAELRIHRSHINPAAAHTPQSRKRREKRNHTYTSMLHRHPRAVYTPQRCTCTSELHIHLRAAYAPQRCICTPKLHIHLKAVRTASSRMYTSDLRVHPNAVLYVELEVMRNEEDKERRDSSLPLRLSCLAGPPLAKLNPKP